MGKTITVVKNKKPRKPRVVKDFLEENGHPNKNY